MLHCLIGSIDALRIALDRDPSCVMALTVYKETLMYLACRSGFVDVATLLILRGSPVNELQKNGSTCLHAVAY